MSEENPETKPETTTTTTPEPKIVTKKVKVEVEKKLTEDEMIVSKRGFTDMQKSLLDLTKEAETAKTEKAELEKTTLLNQLIAINPKYAEVHKEANKDMLLGALATAKAEANQFTELNAGKDKDINKPGPGNHTSFKYDWPASKKAEEHVWAFNN